MPAVLPIGPLMRVFLVALGGALGALTRYGVGLASIHFAEAGLPVGTWVVNGLGCLVIGLALPLVVDERARLLLIVGGLGSFTTFSTYSADTVLLWEAGRRGLAVGNALGSVVVGVVCVAIGLAIGRHLAGSAA